MSEKSPQLYLAFLNSFCNSLIFGTSALIDGGFAPPDLTEIREKLSLPEDEAEPLFTFLTDAGKIIIPERNLAFHSDTIEKGRNLIAGYLNEKGEATVAELKELLGTSRKWVIPLLNYYDRTGLTRREGDVRKHDCMDA